MSSIGQGPAKTSQTSSVNQAAMQDVDFSDESVQRGFSNQNSYSRVEGEQAAKSQATKPSLDEPSADADLDKAAESFLKDFDKGGQKPLSESLKEGFKELQQNPLSSQMSSLQGKKAELQKMGFSQAQIDSMMALANPDDPDNSLSSMHSSSARLNDVNLETGEAKLGVLSETFKEVMTRFSGLTHVPDDLKAALQADVEKLAKAAFNKDQPLDIDSATTMLVSIQSKLQNERLKFDQQNIKIDQINREQSSSKIIQHIRDTIEKLEKAEKSGLIGKIFGYIALAVMAIATVALAVVGAIFTGGVLTAVAISLMVAGLALTATMVASSETDNFMMKIFDGLESGDDKKNARIGAMVFWAAVMIVLTLGAAVLTGGASTGGAAAGAASAATSTAASGTSTGASVAATAANTAASASTTATKIANIVLKLARIAQVISGASQVAEGSSQVATSVYNYQADIARAQAMENKADMLRIQQKIDDAVEAIQQVIDELQSGYSVLASIIRANHETKAALIGKMRA